MTSSELKAKLLHIELLGLYAGIDIAIYYWKDETIGYMANNMFPDEERN